MALKADTPIRKKAEAYLKKLLPSLPVKSTDVGPKYETYKEATGYTQDFLEKHWDRQNVSPPDNTTSCNAFAGEYIRTQLDGPFIGGFNIDKQLEDAGKGAAFVTAKPGLMPRYGDVILHAGRGHMSVIIDVKPWISIQGGFGGSGRKNRYDEVNKGTDSVFNYSAVVGWIDLDQLFVSKVSVPYWIQGWWSVTWDEDTYYYFFNTDWSVTWTYQKPPKNTSVKLPKDGGQGTFSLPDGRLQVNWRSGSVENFWYGTSTWPTEFWGKHNDEGVLHVKRLQA